jgi:hypothetical protein
MTYEKFITKVSLVHSAIAIHVWPKAAGEMDGAADLP